MNLFNTAEVANQLGITQRRVQALAKNGRAGSRVGRDYVFTFEDIEKLRIRIAGRPKSVK